VPHPLPIVNLQIWRNNWQNWRANFTQGWTI
jgi:hypothetical protein